MIKWSVQVFSSNIDKVGWDDTGHLIVDWKSGKTSRYGPGVSEEQASATAKAPSVTEAVNKNIKPHYGHKYD